MLKRSKLVLSLVVAMVVLAAVGFTVPAFASDGTSITILHVNDVHGRLDPFVPSGGKDPVGGMSKVAAQVEKLRETGANILLLSAGDMIHGTNVVNLFGGQPMIEVMNEMGFDVMTLGNHEYNYGQDRLIYLKGVADFPLLAANVVYDDGGMFVGDYVIREFDGVKIGIFGLSPQETPIVTHPNNVIGLKFLDPTEVSSKIVSELRQQVDIVLLLSHLGYSEDKKLAAAVDGIDIIVGGHSHTLLSSPERVGNTVIVQAGEYAQNLGILNIVVVDGKIVEYGGMLDPMAAALPQSEPTSPVGAIIASYSQSLSDKLAVTVGHTPVALQGERSQVRTRTTNLSNLITDAMREATNADIVITNGGGIRASIAAGDIKVGDIYTTLPFDNTLAVVELSGEQVLAALEHGVEGYPAEAGSFAQVSGLVVKFDPDKPAKNRVVEVLVDGEPLDLAKHYTVATNDFMAAGGDGYVWFADGKLLFSSGDMLRDVLAAYVEAHGTVNPSDEARVIPIK